MSGGLRRYELRNAYLIADGQTELLHIGAQQQPVGHKVIMDAQYIRRIADFGKHKNSDNLNLLFGCTKVIVATDVPNPHKHCVSRVGQARKNLSMCVLILTW